MAPCLGQQWYSVICFLFSVLWSSWPSSSVSMWPSCIMGVTCHSVPSHFPSTQCCGHVLLSSSWSIFDHGLPTHLKMGTHKSSLEGPVPLYAGLHIYAGSAHWMWPASLPLMMKWVLCAGCQPDLEILGPQSFRMTGQATPDYWTIWVSGRTAMQTADSCWAWVRSRT